MGVGVGWQLWRLPMSNRKKASEIMKTCVSFIFRKQNEIVFNSSERKRTINFQKIIILQIKINALVQKKYDFCKVCLYLDSVIRIRKVLVSLAQHNRDGIGASHYDFDCHFYTRIWKLFLPPKLLKLDHGSLYYVIQALCYFLDKRFP